MTEPTTEAGRSWAARRAGVAERWSKMAAALGSPASAFEVAGAVAADAVTDLNVPPPNRTAYDRRALLNVIAVLLDVPREGDTMSENGRVFRLTWVIDREATARLVAEENR